MRLQIFCDFDGTATEQDVGQEFFLRFGRRKECLAAVEAWLSGRISSAEMYLREFAGVRAEAAEVERFARSMRLRRGFVEFVNDCRSRGDQLFVVSDGFAFYIRLILQMAGLSEMEVLANDWRFEPGGRLRPLFPFLQQSCGRCANCKGHHVRARRCGRLQIYIGDGYSDRCGAAEADIIFARRDLARFCEEQEWTYYAYEDFEDVRKILEKIRRSR